MFLPLYHWALLPVLPSCWVLTLPVVLVIAGAGEGDHHGAVEGQHHGTEAPAPPATLVREALQLPRQVEGGEAKAGERD